VIELSTPTVGSRGRVALVTGAARGIGLGIAAWLISEGWQVVLSDLDRVRGSKVAKVLGDNAWFIAMDVSNEGQVALGVAEVLTAVRSSTWPRPAPGSRNPTRRLTRRVRAVC
jgi:NAD(P)-dependent dehydrogenase (short-subunit alcohol dehydrogenase family)